MNIPRGEHTPTPAPRAARCGRRQSSAAYTGHFTRSPATRTLLRVEVAADRRAHTDERVESLMGRRPELRFAFIQENARFVAHLDV